MKKLILLGCITLFSFTQAKMVDGIACIVDGEAVTVAEIKAVQQQFHISKQEATDLLIKDRLQTATLKNIDIQEIDIDKKISEIATQNNLTVPKMQQILKQQGTSWSKYRKSIRKALKKEKFYQEKILNTIPDPNEDEMKLYYHHHQKEFFLPATLKLIEYSAKTKESMKQFLQTKKTKGIKSHALTKQTTTLNPTLMAAILQTENGHYTHIFNAGDRYISYKVLSKQGKTEMPYAMAKNAIIIKWKQQQQNKKLKDYFEKLKTNCDVQYIRK